MKQKSKLLDRNLKEFNKDSICCVKCGGTDLMGRYHIWYHLDENGDMSYESAGNDYNHYQETYCTKCKEFGVDITTIGEYIENYIDEDDDDPFKVYGEMN